jgi:hypothetical protein
MCKYIYTHTHSLTHIHTHSLTHTHTHTHKHTHTCTYIAYTHTHTHTHTHTLVASLECFSSIEVKNQRICIKSFGIPKVAWTRDFVKARLEYGSSRLF